MSTTTRDLLSECLRACGAFGVGQTPGAQDINDALRTLNRMLGQWGKKRWLLYQVETLSLVSTGAVSYSVGPTGDFVIPIAPNELLGAYVRLQASSPQPVDYSLNIITSMEDYSNIAVKNLGSFPTHAFLNSGWPLGTIYFWPVPAASIYSLFILLKIPFQVANTLDSVIDLPPEYEAALFYNLVVRLYSSYRLPPDPISVALAKEGLATLRKANLQLSTVSMPQELERKGKYNIYSDQTY